MALPAILILDEPQKILRYSVTHKQEHNKIYRLDALGAYNQGLVKKIAVRGIAMKGLSRTNAYLYLASIEVFTNRAPEAHIELEIRQVNGIKRITRKITKSENLLDTSRELDQYKGYVVADIDATHNSGTFTNGVVLEVGAAQGDVNEATLRRIQIRETVKAHFDKEQLLFAKGIKVLKAGKVSFIRYFEAWGRDQLWTDGTRKAMSLAARSTTFAVSGMPP